MTRWQKFQESLTVNVLTNVLILIASAGIGTVSGARLALESEFASDHVLELSVTIFALLGMAGLFIWRRIDRFRPHYRRQHPPYRVLSKEVTYQYLSRTQMLYTKNIKIKTLRSGIDAFTDKYAWTGAGKMRVSSGLAEQSIVNLGVRNIWQIYQVHFGFNAPKGKEIQMAIRWELEDDLGRAQPFMSQTIDMPTNELKMRVIVPESFGVQTAIKKIRPNIDILDDIYTETMPVRNGFAEWTVSRPKLFHCYELAWLDPGAKPAIPGGVVTTGSSDVSTSTPREATKAS
ncbi:hypothetical protein brsh051_09980 [Brooklawnia propionicigenes]|uniref:Uncharacterized protein n=2 Tax=Brooklawnia propionicigenes TaxID=3041175 RepID=A0AAN0K9A1_9ACTN|nr:hypothetical protein brsh051_09980 [Brooklawnia sp. SH051]